MSDIKTSFDLTPQEKAWSYELTGVADTDVPDLLRKIRAAKRRGMKITVIAEYPTGHPNKVTTNYEGDNHYG